MSVRSTDPITSRLAEPTVETRKDNEERVLNLLVNSGPMTSREIATALDMEYVTVSPLLCPLARDGAVHRAGTKINPESGKRAMTWAFGGTPGGMPAVATGPQTRLKFRRFETWKEFLTALGWGKGKTETEVISALNEEIVQRIG